MSLDRAVPPNPFDFLPAVPALAVSSTDIADGEKLAPEFLGGEGGKNTSPALSWEAGPEGTASYAVVCFDFDAPTPGGLWHWILADIPAGTTSLPLGAGTGEPAVGRGLSNDLGSTQYEGAAPPPGDREHRYGFYVYALGTPELAVESGAPAALAGFHLTVNSLARGGIVALA